MSDLTGSTVPTIAPRVRNALNIQITHLTYSSALVCADKFQGIGIKQYGTVMVYPPFNSISEIPENVR